MAALKWILSAEDSVKACFMPMPTNGHGFLNMGTKGERLYYAFQAKADGTWRATLPTTAAPYQAAEILSPMVEDGEEVGVLVLHSGAVEVGVVDGGTR